MSDSERNQPVAGLAEQAANWVPPWSRSPEPPTTDPAAESQPEQGVEQRFEPAAAPDMVTVPAPVAEPEAADEPDSDGADVPELVAAPDAADAPDHAAGPDAADLPELLAEPAVVSAPEQVLAPDVAAVPELVAEPAVVSASEPVPAPGVAAVPELVGDLETGAEPEGYARDEPHSRKASAPEVGLAEQAASWVPPWSRVPEPPATTEQARDAEAAATELGAHSTDFELDPAPAAAAEREPDAGVTSTTAGPDVADEVGAESGEVVDDLDELIGERFGDDLRLDDLPAGEPARAEYADDVLLPGEAEAEARADQLTAERSEPESLHDDGLVAEMVPAGDEGALAEPGEPAEAVDSDGHGSSAEVPHQRGPVQPQEARPLEPEPAQPQEARSLAPEPDMDADEPAVAEPAGQSAAGVATGVAATALGVAPPGISPAQLHPALEAIMMVVDEPVSEITLAQVLDVPAEEVANALIDLSASYTREGRGFDLRRAAGGWRFYTRADYSAYVERFVLDGQQLRLTQASLETLAVIAYKQPVTRSRISAIRGVNCDGVIRTLITRGMVEECGTELESGAHLYRTTSLFLEKLGLDSVDQLPPLAPFLPDNVEEIVDEQR